MIMRKLLQSETGRRIVYRGSINRGQGARVSQEEKEAKLDPRKTYFISVDDVQT